VDLDLPKGTEHTPEAFALLLAKINALSPLPTLTIFSGGGYQAFWRFPAPLPASEHTDRIEKLNERIESQIGGDRCHNVNRLMRLPGTINVLSATKRAAGRQPALAHVVDADWDRTWDPTSGPTPSLAGLQSRRNGHALPGLEALPETWQRVIRTGDASDYANDRSRAFAAVARVLVEQDWSDVEIMTMLLNPEYGISAHALDQSDAKRAARHAIELARKVTPEIAEVNLKHAVILIGNKVAVLRETITTEGRPGFNLLTPGAFKQWFAPRRVVVGEKTVPATIRFASLGRLERRGIRAGTPAAPHRSTPSVAPARYARRCASATIRSTERCSSGKWAGVRVFENRRRPNPSRPPQPWRRAFPVRRFVRAQRSSREPRAGSGIGNPRSPRSDRQA
jgi:hypothetical protein